MFYTCSRINTDKILTLPAKTKLFKQMKLFPFHYDNKTPRKEMVLVFLFFSSRKENKTKNGEIVTERNKTEKVETTVQTFT